MTDDRNDLGPTAADREIGWEGFANARDLGGHAGRLRARAYLLAAGVTADDLAALRARAVE